MTQALSCVNDLDDLQRPVSAAATIDRIIAITGLKRALSNGTNRHKHTFVPVAVYYRLLDT